MASENKITKEILMDMEIGDVIYFGASDIGLGYLREIQRVVGGWIYIFQLNQSCLNTVFVEEKP